MISLNNVHKSYGSFTAVKNISFEVGRNEIVGLLGPNGAGKTTIMRILTSCHYPSGGSVKIRGMEIPGESREIQRLIGYLPEHAAVYPELTVAEQLDFHARVRLSGSRRIREGVRFAVESCGLEDVFHRRISRLSKGYRQRVGLAQAILHDPDILILDEPTSGLDPNQIRDIRALIRRLGREKTIILSTHIMQEVEALCSRVLILNKGSIAAQGSPETIAGNMRSSETYRIRFRDIDSRLVSELKNCAEVESLKPVNPPEATDSSGMYEVVMTDKAGQGNEFLFSWAVEHQVVIRELTPIRPGLEDLFSRLTKEEE